MPGHTLIAVPILLADPPLDTQIRTAQAAGADLVELRVDRIANVPAVQAVLARPHALPVIVTVRSAAEGGAWTGAEAERIALLERLVKLRPDYIDVEYAAWKCSRRLQTAVRTTRWIVSHHDVADTPADLNPILDDLAATPADVLKAVFTAQDATDACRVLAQLRSRAARRPTVALAMGEAGLATRILARKFGAFLTFASLHAEGQSAPGQPTIDELRGRYRWDDLGPETRVYGVAGWPVSHSQSPAIHNAAHAALRIDAVYVPFPVQPGFAAFAAFMDCVHGERGLAVDGLSVTLPHKEDALRWLDEHGFIVSPFARRCGAVNTLVRCADGAWAGENTDGPAALTALQTASRCVGNQLRGQRVGILGAGGVARAIVAALQGMDCQITLYGRSPDRAQQLAQDLRCAWQPWAARVDHAGDILVNCTPVGMWPNGGDSPMPDEALGRATVVFDTVYRPAQSRLLCAARARGCEVVSGRVMFLAQAAAQFKLWHGRPPPAEVMRTALVSDEA